MERGLELRAADEVAEGMETRPDWALLGRLPMCLSAVVTLPGFKVRNLLELKRGQVFQSRSPSSADVPLEVSGVALGWVEFEVVERKMAVRLTRLA